MKVKVTNVNKELKDRKYPYLGIGEVGSDDYRIVFFYAPNTGIVIFDESKFFGVGFQAFDWKEQAFGYFTGSLTMENEP
jgi:hypothetical protein